MLLRIDRIALGFILLVSISYNVDCESNVFTTVQRGLQNNCGSTKAPTPFVKIGNKYYHIGTQKLDWFNANQACRRISSHLAYIQNDAEMTAIANYLESHNFNRLERLWYSANCIGHKHGDWWSMATGYQMNYFRWAPGQPDNGKGNEPCVQLWYTRSKWQANDMRCDEAWHYICQTSDPKTIVLTAWEGF